MQKLLIALPLAMVLTTPAQAGWFDFLKAEKYPYREPGTARTDVLKYLTKDCLQHEPGEYDFCYCKAEFIATNLTTKVEEELKVVRDRPTNTPAYGALIDEANAKCSKWIQ